MPCRKTGSDHVGIAGIRDDHLGEVLAALGVMENCGPGQFSTLPQTFVPGHIAHVLQEPRLGIQRQARDLTLALGGDVCVGSRLQFNLESS